MKKEARSRTLYTIVHFCFVRLSQDEKSIRFRLRDFSSIFQQPISSSLLGWADEWRLLWADWNCSSTSRSPVENSDFFKSKIFQFFEKLKTFVWSEIRRHCIFRPQTISFFNSIESGPVEISHMNHNLSKKIALDRI